MNPRFLACLGAAALILGSTGPQEKKVPVPDQASQEKVLKEIRNLFKAKYAKRDRAARLVLAKELLHQAGRMGDDPTSRYVLLCEARDVAVEGLGLALAFAAISKLSEGYDLAPTTPTAMKVAALKKAKRHAKGLEELRALAGAYLQTAREGMRLMEYDPAGEAAKEASSTARLARDQSLSQEAKDLSKEIASLKRVHAEVSKAELILSANPEDPDANLILGRFWCFARRDWERGLPYLARGSDEALKKLAAMEQTKPEDAASQSDLGDAWYELAGKTRNSLEKGRYFGRAREWYERAREKASGLLGIKIGKRLEELRRKEAPSGRDMISQGLVGAWDLSEGRGNIAGDASGHGLRGELRHMSTTQSWVSGMPLTRVALAFDGVDDYVKVEGDKVWDAIDRQLTLTAWVYKTANQENARCLVSRQLKAGTGEHFYLGFRDNRPFCIVSTGTGHVSHIAETPVPERTWTHLAMTYDGKAMRLYKDGKQIAIRPVTGILGDDRNPVTIGANENSETDRAQDNFAGRIARVRIFSRALKASEIARMASGRR
jgi:hypothetical protein